jgi:hypothetical protein
MTDTSIRSLLLTTPMRDLLRLRLTGRLAWRKAVRRAELPVEVRGLVESVVGRTRLWRLEKAEVAEELIGHFVDGIDRGRPTSELLASFGDPKSAARLIRRAKIRGRPWLWRSARALLTIAKWAVVVLLMYYAILAIQFFAGRPVAAVDYLAAINRQAQQTPVDQRAWPLYRQAILQMGVHRLGHPFPPDIYRYMNQTKQLREWIAAHAGSMDLIRQAAARPGLGFILGPGGSQDDPKLYPGSHVHNELGDDTLAATLLPELSQLYGLSRLLGDDADWAVELHDGNRLNADLVAEWQMADQFSHNPDEFLINCLVGVGMRVRMLDQLDRVLANHPDVLSDSQLIGLAHRLATARTVSDWIKIGGERMVIADTIQRIFTDDGHGNGHLTARGMRFLQHAGIFSAGPFDMDPIEHPFVSKMWSWTPMQVAMLAVTSRKDFADRMNRVTDAAVAESRRPLRESDGRSPDALIAQMKESDGFRVEYWPFFTMLFGTNANLENCERILGHRDGILVAIALELFHRDTGRYPATLQELVTRWLPAVPADRITGEPVKYRLIDGKPRVYSVGVDQVDDGGTPVQFRSAAPRDLAGAAAQWFGENADYQGDWILYPQSEFNPAT